MGALFIPPWAVLLMVFAKGWFLFHLGAFLFPFSMGFVLPAFMAFLTSLGAKQEHGLRVGQAQSIQALMTVIVTLVGGKLLSVNDLSTSLMGALFMAIAFVLYLWVAAVRKRA